MAGDAEFEVTAEAFANLHLTRAVILEALRLYPPVWNLPRVAISQVTEMELAETAAHLAKATF